MRGLSSVFRRQCARKLVQTPFSRVPDHISSLAASERIQKSCCLSTNVVAAGPPRTTPSFRSDRSPPVWLDSALPVLQRAKLLLDSTRTGSTDDIAILLKQLGQEQTLPAMVLAEQILQRLCHDKRTDNRPVPMQLWQSVLYAWGNMGNMRRAEALLQQFLDECHWDQQHQVTDAPQPDIYLFNTFLWGLAKAGYADQARKYLVRLHEYHEQRGWHCRPNTKSYTWVLQAHAKSSIKRGIEALQVLRQMQQQHEHDKQLYEQQYGIVYNDSSPLKRKIVTPDAVAYGVTMNALRHDVEAVMELFQECVDLKKVDGGLFVMVLTTLAQRAGMARTLKGRLEAAKLAEDVFRMRVEWGLLQSQEPASVAQASDVLDVRDDASNPEDSSPLVHTKTGDDDLLTAFCAALSAWSRVYSPEAVVESERMLRDMMVELTCVPNVVAFNTVIYAWSRSNSFHADAPRKALELLNLQLEWSTKYPKARPDFQTYGTVLSTIANSYQDDKVEQCQKVIEAMLEGLSTGRVERSRNPSAPFTALLTGIAKTSPPPSTIETDSPFTAEVSHDKDLYSIALRVYQDVLDDAHGLGTTPDQHLFVAMLGVIAAHCPVGSSERSSMAKTVFDKACDAGHVSEKVAAAFAKVIGRVGQDLESMPRHWFRNVSSSYRYGGKEHKNRRNRAASASAKTKNNDLGRTERVLSQPSHNI